MADEISVEEMKALLQDLSGPIQEKTLPEGLKFALLLMRPGAPAEIAHVTDAAPEDAVKGLRAMANGLEKREIKKKVS